MSNNFCNYMEEAKQPVEEKINQDAPNLYLIPSAIIVAGALIAGAVMYSTSSRQVPPKGNTATVGVIASGMNNGNLADDDPFLGDDWTSADQLFHFSGGTLDRQQGQWPRDSGPGESSGRGQSQWEQWRRPR